MAKRRTEHLWLNADEKAFLEIYEDRQKDKRQLKSKRQRSLETPIRPISSLIGSLFNHDRQALKKIEENRAIMAWNSMIGECAARVSKAIRLRGHQLVVRVSDPLWMTQLGYLKHDLIQKYQTQFPHLGITDIFFTR